VDQSTKAWAAKTQQVQQLLWSNPRYVFFREEALSDFDAAFGPKSAQGVATPGRSIAVDPGGIPTARRCGWPQRARCQPAKTGSSPRTPAAPSSALCAPTTSPAPAPADRLAIRRQPALRLWVLWPK
jgi:membrane-bound lytic murein transglycosylase A